MKVCSDYMDLSFMGSGFPLFYNFLKWCFIILLVFCLSNGVYTLYSNYNGAFCNHPDIIRDALSGATSLTAEESEHEAGLCHDNFFHRLQLKRKFLLLINCITSEQNRPLG